MNIGQVNGTGANALQHEKAPQEVDSQLQQKFEKQLTMVDKNIDLLSLKGEQKVGDRASREKAEKEEQESEAVNHNMEMAMTRQSVLKNIQQREIARESFENKGVQQQIAGKEMMEKDSLQRVAEEGTVTRNIQANMSRKDQSYQEIVKENIAEDKSEYVLPTLKKGEEVAEGKKATSEEGNRFSGEENKARAMNLRDLQNGTNSQENFLGKKNTIASWNEISRNLKQQKTNRLGAETQNFSVKSAAQQDTAGKLTAMGAGIQRPDTPDTAKNVKNRVSNFDATMQATAEGEQAKSGKKVELAAKTEATTKPTPDEEQANIRKITGNVKIMLSAQKGEMVMKMSPEHLGKLEFKLRKNEENKMNAQLTVESVDAKSMLEGQLPELQRSLAEQGVQVEEFVIHVQGDETGFGDSSFAQNQQQSQNFSDSGTTVASTNNQTAEQTAESVVQQGLGNDSNSGLNLFA